MTSDEKEAAKREKKRDKLEAKLAKKQTTAGQVVPHLDKPNAGTAPQPQDDATISPAERSAQAAERQVRLQSLRVLFALLGVLLTAAMLLWTIRPWEKQSNAPAQTMPESTTETLDE